MQPGEGRDDLSLAPHHLPRHSSQLGCKVAGVREIELAYQLSEHGKEK
jgi:hypothetical protein